MTKHAIKLADYVHIYSLHTFFQPQIVMNKAKKYNTLIIIDIVLLDENIQAWTLAFQNEYESNLD
jgi:Ni,Fe-hydrogenase maturation factor